MLTANDVAQVFDTILSSPGMNDAVKIELRTSRKNVLLLTSVIEQGLLEKGDAKGNLLASASDDAKEELRSLADDFLQRAGLSELSEKIKALSATK